MYNTLIKKNIRLNFVMLIFALCAPCSLLLSEVQKAPMKILMVVATFPKIHDICMLNQITGLIDRGHEVHVYAFQRGDCVKVQNDVITYDLINKTFFEQLPSDLNYYDIIVFQLGHKAFDVKKTHNFKGKVVICLRGYDITGFLREKPHAYDGFFKTCDLFMPVCNAFKAILKNEGCPDNKIVVHHSAIDCSSFTFQIKKFPKDGPINILSAGRFVQKKGFIHSIRAIAQLVKKYPRIRYTIIGDGALKEKYKKLIKKLGLGDKVFLNDWYAHEEYIKILDQSHIFVLPSVTAKNNDQEGIPNVLKEAMAMGLLVVATDHSGNGELIHDGVSGLLVPERSSTAIAKAIEYMLLNPSKWSTMQLCAATKVHQEFDNEKENDKLEKILYNLFLQ